VHVCQRWRNLILGSASYLDLCLVCTFGTPVADMLAHSPPLPLIIDHNDVDGTPTAEDEEGIVLALKQRDRVHRIRLCMPVLKLQKLLMTIEEEYPILECMILAPSIKEDRALILPGTLRAPHLHHLVLSGFAFPLPTESRLLTTAIRLVTFFLYIEHPSTDPRPTVLLRWLSSMPQLEMFFIGFSHPVPHRDLEGQPIHGPVTTRVTLPNLRRLVFQGVSAYLESLVRRITAPSLEKLDIIFFEQLTFFVPRLLQFMNTVENLEFSCAKVQLFNESVSVDVYTREEAEMCTLSICIHCRHFDRQVSSVSQISDSLSQIFSAVEDLTLEHEVHDQSSEEHNEADRTEWRKLLRSFTKVKTLRIDHGLVGDLSRCLQLDDGELALELLPELQVLTISGTRSGDVDNAFTSFIDACQNAGRPVTVTLESNCDEVGNDLNT
jgi:hypothetical protein